MLQVGCGVCVQEAEVGLPGGANSGERTRSGRRIPYQGACAGWVRGAVADFLG